MVKLNNGLVCTIPHSAKRVKYINEVLYFYDHGKCVNDGTTISEIGFGVAKILRFPNRKNMFGRDLCGTKVKLRNNNVLTLASPCIRKKEPTFVSYSLNPKLPSIIDGSSRSEFCVVRILKYEAAAVCHTPS